MHELTNVEIWITLVATFFTSFSLGMFFEKRRDNIALKERMAAEAKSLRNEYLIELKIILSQVVTYSFCVMEESAEPPGRHYAMLLLNLSENAAFAGDYRTFGKEARQTLKILFDNVSPVFQKKNQAFFEFLEDAFDGIEDDYLPETITELAVFSKTVGEREPFFRRIFETLCKNENPSV